MTTFRRSRTIARYTYITLLLVAGAGLLGGCNLFGSGDLDNGDTVEELISDADVAISKGNYDAAVETLEEAYDKEPENPEVRIKLSTALFGQADVDVIDLKRLVDYVSGLEDDSANLISQSKNGLQCSLEAAEPDPIAEGYTEIELEETGVFSPFISNEARIDRVVSEIIDREFSATDAFRALPVDLQASWLTITSFAEISEAILVVYNEADARGGRLFRDSNDGVVYCAPEQADLDALECEAYRVAEQEDLIGEESLLSAALRHLEQKNSQYGASEDTGLLPEALQALIDAVQSNIDQEDRQACASTRAV